MRSGAEKGWWRGKAAFAAVLAVSAGILALDFSGRSPVKAVLASAVSPVLKMAGAGDPPRIDGGAEEARVRRLEAANARLVNEVFSLRKMLESISGSPFDGKRYPFRGIPAAVIAGAGDQGLRRMVLVDRGRKDGVKKGMGVVDADTVIGRTFIVGEEKSYVLLVTDPACRIRCTAVPPAGDETPQAPRFQAEGLCEGDPDRSDRLELIHIPRHFGIEAGWKVVTTGLSGVFPAGMTVGTVTDVSADSGLFQSIGLRPAAGGRLDSVLILTPCVPQKEE